MIQIIVTYVVEQLENIDSDKRFVCHNIYDFASLSNLNLPSIDTFNAQIPKNAIDETMMNLEPFHLISSHVIVFNPAHPHQA